MRALFEGSETVAPEVAPTLAEQINSAGETSQERSLVDKAGKPELVDVADVAPGTVKFAVSPPGPCSIGGSSTAEAAPRLNSEQYLEEAFKFDDALEFLTFFRSEAPQVLQRYEALCKDNGNFDEFSANPLGFIVANNPTCCIQVAKRFINIRVASNDTTTLSSQVHEPAASPPLEAPKAAEAPKPAEVQTPAPEAEDPTLHWMKQVLYTPQL
jgi:hypothetical protein